MRILPRSMSLFRSLYRSVADRCPACSFILLRHAQRHSPLNSHTNCAGLPLPIHTNEPIPQSLKLKTNHPHLLPHPALAMAGSLLLLLLVAGVNLAVAMPALVLQPSAWRFKASYPDYWNVRYFPAMRDSITGEELQGSTTTHLWVKSGVKPEPSRRTWAAIEYTTNIAPVEVAQGDMCTEADHFRATRRVRLSAQVEVHGLAPSIGWAGLYLGVLDARGYEMGLDNMHNRPILGASFKLPAVWYTVVVNVPPGAASLEYGLHMVGGTGSATISHLTLQWVSQDVPLTTPFAKLPPLDKFVPPDFGSPGFGIPWGTLRGAYRL